MLAQAGEIGMVRSDNGSEFVSRSFKGLLASNNIKQVFSDAGTPQSNGAIERINGVLKRLIFQSISRDDDSDWVKKLPQLVENINSTISRSTNKTANEMEQFYKTKNAAELDKVYAREA